MRETIGRERLQKRFGGAGIMRLAGCRQEAELQLHGHNVDWNTSQCGGLMFWVNLQVP